jgi:hypothetical protein
MKAIIGYIRQYFYETNKWIFGFAAILTATLIYFNYHFGIDQSIGDRANFWFRFSARSCIFFIAFALPYVGYALVPGKNYFRQPRFIMLLCIAPLIFSLKVAMEIDFSFSQNLGDDNFWNHVVYWPLLLLITASILFVIWRLFDKQQPFYGLRTRNINWRPYLIMLLIMLPLIAAASTQPDFQAMYPKLKSITDVADPGAFPWWRKALFELSYGSDFITIELFFRGFLILAFIKWAGKDAILPMACFYCTIHFGKPLGECISSFFGGIILGIVVYHTRSILGGLMVHLGIAWLMEIAGYYPLSS